MATLNLLRFHLTFAQKSLTFLTISIFRMLCHLSVICVVYSDLKIVCQKKMELPNSVKIVQNPLLGQKTLMLCKN